MKNLFCLLVMLAFTTSLHAQQDLTVCHTSPTEKFAMFASNKDFNAEHQKPRAYVHVSQEGGKMISFKTPDGQEGKGYLLEAKTKSNNWIFVFQEWWGLNDNIKRHSEELFRDLGNVNVLALDMYDGKVSTDRETAAKYMQEFKQERGDAIVKGAISYAGGDAVIGTIGWCFGGGQSIQAALTAGQRAVVSVIYYGMPVTDPEKLKSLNAEVLGLFASRDKYITPEVVKQFEEAMKKAGKKVTIKSYDAEHGFANPSNSIFDKAATEDAYAKTLEIFRRTLK
jgi:carboxymethylenebutenolidase